MRTFDDILKSMQTDANIRLGILLDTNPDAIFTILFSVFSAAILESEQAALASLATLDPTAVTSDNSIKNAQADNLGLLLNSPREIIYPSSPLTIQFGTSQPDSVAKGDIFLWLYKGINYQFITLQDYSDLSLPLDIYFSDTQLKLNDLTNISINSETGQMQYIDTSDSISYVPVITGTLALNKEDDVNYRKNLLTAYTRSQQGYIGGMKSALDKFSLINSSAIFVKTPDIVFPPSADSFSRLYDLEDGEMLIIISLSSAVQQTISIDNPIYSAIAIQISQNLSLEVRLYKGLIIPKLHQIPIEFINGQNANISFYTADDIDILTGGLTIKYSGSTLSLNDINLIQDSLDRYIYQNSTIGSTFYTYEYFCYFKDNIAATLEAKIKLVDIERGGISILTLESKKDQIIVLSNKNSVQVTPI